MSSVSGHPGCGNPARRVDDPGTTYFTGCSAVTVSSPFTFSATNRTLLPSLMPSTSAGLFKRNVIVIFPMPRLTSGSWEMVIWPSFLWMVRTTPSVHATAGAAALAWPGAAERALRLRRKRHGDREQENNAKKQTTVHEHDRISLG